MAILGFGSSRGTSAIPEVVAEVARDADAIVNFAAESHVDRSLINAGEFVQTDVFGTYVLLEAARKFRHQRFLQVSTDEVYGHVKDGRSRESDSLRPEALTRRPRPAARCWCRPITPATTCPPW